MWVKLNVVKRLLEGGREVPHYPGEWVDVPNKQLAEMWIQAGDAIRPDIPTLVSMPGCGVVTPNSLVKTVYSNFEVVSRDLPDRSFPRTLWTRNALDPELVISGFTQLDTWDIVAPIYSYDELAETLPEAEEASKLLRDLRVPYYSTDTLFYRDNEVVTALLDEWLADDPLAQKPLELLKAIYIIKPLVLAVPPHWRG